MLNDKKQARLDQLLAAFDTGAVQPDELMKAIDAVMAVIDSTSVTLAKLVDSTDTDTKRQLKAVESKLDTAVSKLERYSSQIDADKATKADVEKMANKVAKEIDRVISLIPSLPDEFDASEIYEMIEEHKSLLSGISELIVGENIRNALEALPEGEKLAIEAIEGLREELNKRIEGVRSTTALIARRLDQIGDVSIAGVTDGQVLTYQASTNTWIPTTVSGSGVSDGDKGDITVSGSGTTWTIDNDTIGLDELSATGTPSASTFLRGDNTWATPSGSGDMVAATYDPQNIAADAFDVDNHTSGTTNKVYTATEQTKLSNISVTQAVDLDALETASHAALTVTDSTEIDFTLTGQDLTASIKASSIDETKLDASVNASLDLADSASQPGHTHAISDITSLQTTLDGKQDEAVVVSGSLTASLDQYYINVASATYTDPSPTEGKGFVVFVRNGTATVGGTGYGTAGTIIYRIYYSGAWANYAYQVSSTFALASHTHTASQITDFDTEVSNNTDVAANTSARHSAVTLSGTPDYITLVGQDIVRGQIDLTADVTGDLPFANIAQISTARVLGRTTAGTGDIEQLSSVDSFVSAASDTTAGKVELAIGSEVTTGTDATRAVTPDALAGSEFGKRTIAIQVSGSASGDSALATGDGLAALAVDSTLNGMNIVAVKAYVTTVSSSGNPTFAIRRSRRTNATTRSIVDTLSTSLSIDANEFSSEDATTAAVINTSNDDLATGDVLLIDCDTAGTGTKGATILITCQLP